MTCKWYAEFEGICCQGDCPECADICPYEEEQTECEFYESEVRRYEENYQGFSNGDWYICKCYITSIAS